MEVFQRLTVLSLEQATVLPYLTYRLAMDGMRVIRLEHPVHGDPNRKVGHNFLNEPVMNSYFMAINAGKQSLTLNLIEKEGVALLDELLIKLKVDIFATNQLPRNYNKLSISYQRLSAIKPDLIWLGITGFGPNSNEAAYDPILQAKSGLMELTGPRDGDPQVLGVPLPDMGSSEHAYGLIMKALFQRQVTGRGQQLNLSMFQSTVSWLTVPLMLAGSFGQTVSRRGNTHEFFAPVSVYRTRDGFVYIAVGNDKQWMALTKQSGFQHLGREEYQTNAGRIKDVNNLNDKLGACFVRFSTDEILDILKSIGVPASRINTIDQVRTEPLVQDNFLKAVDQRSGWTITLAPPPYPTQFLLESGGQLSFPPRFGEHNEAIFGDLLGRSPEEISRLKAGGII